MKPETLKVIQAVADLNADNRIAMLEQAYPSMDTLLRIEIKSAIRGAYIHGADAGYTAAKAEARES